MIFLMLGLLSAGFLFREKQVEFSVVTGHSMSPALAYGDLLKITRKVNVEPGDIIVYQAAGAKLAGTTIAHRVIQVIEKNGLVTGFRTMGDNNHNNPDPWVVPVADVLGKVSFRISYLGILLLFLKSTPGTVFLVLSVCFSTFLLYSEELMALSARRLQAF